MSQPQNACATAIPVYTQARRLNVRKRSQQLAVNMPPRMQERRQDSPSSSVSGSSVTLVDDEAAAPVDSDNKNVPRNPLWLQQFAEQTRQAHLRNSARGLPSLPLSASVFNPQARTFTPTAINAHAAALAQPQMPVPLRIEPQHTRPEVTNAIASIELEAVMDSSPLKVRHPWLSYMRRGSATVDHKARWVQAQNVVSMGPWDSTTLAELARNMSVRATEHCGDEAKTTALFARDLYSCLEQDQGESYASEFLYYLCEFVQAEFVARWRTDLPTSVIRLRAQNHPDASSFVSSALAIAAFVASLFTQALVPKEFVYLSLSLLVREMCSLEQLRAVHVIITRVDERLYDAHSMTDFTDTVRTKAAKLTIGEVDQSQVQPYVQEICDIVHTWTLAHLPPVPANSGPTEKGENLNEERTPRSPLRTRVEPNNVLSETEEMTRPGASFSYSDVVRKAHS